MILDPSIKPPRYFKWARNCAGHSEHGIYKMGAIIIRSGQIIAVGWNKNKSHPKAKNYTTKIHAELDALIMPRIEDVFDAHMYVVRLTNGGALATSKPCKDCMILIQEAGLASVTYIDDQGQIKTEKL